MQRFRWLYKVCTNCLRKPRVPPKNNVSVRTGPLPFHGDIFTCSKRLVRLKSYRVSGNTDLDKFLNLRKYILTWTEFETLILLSLLIPVYLQ